jgi:hypothetical protein
MGKSSFAVRIFRTGTITQSFHSWHGEVHSHRHQETTPTANKDYSYRKGPPEKYQPEKNIKPATLPIATRKLSNKKQTHRKK